MTTFMEILQVRRVVEGLVNIIVQVFARTDFEFDNERHAIHYDHGVYPMSHPGYNELQVEPSLKAIKCIAQ